MPTFVEDSKYANIYKFSSEDGEPGYLELARSVLWSINEDKAIAIRKFNHLRDLDTSDFRIDPSEPEFEVDEVNTVDVETLKIVAEYIKSKSIPNLYKQALITYYIYKDEYINNFKYIVIPDYVVNVDGIPLSRKIEEYYKYIDDKVSEVLDKLMEKYPQFIDDKHDRSYFLNTNPSDVRKYIRKHYEKDAEAIIEEYNKIVTIRSTRGGGACSREFIINFIGFGEDGNRRSIDVWENRVKNALNSIYSMKPKEQLI